MDIGVRVFLLLLVSVVQTSGMDQAPAKSLLSAKRAYLRNDSDDKKLFSKIVEQVKEWGHWEITIDEKAADIFLVLSIKQEPVEEIRLKSLDEPHTDKPPEYYEVRTLTASDRWGKELASFSTRVGWTAHRDAKQLVNKFRDLIGKAEGKRAR